ncbi:hypothetical protein ABZ511_17890 [Nocardia gamkensis]
MWTHEVHHTEAGGYQAMWRLICSRAMAFLGYRINLKTEENG